MMNKSMVAVLCAVSVAITTLPACGIFTGQESAGQYVDDATISNRVRARFVEDKQVSAMRLGVETMQGTVQLTGFSTSASEKERAGEIARAVPGVKAVRNDVIVQATKK